MAPDIQKITLEWLEQNQIKELFEVMTSQLLFHKPADPKSFLIELLRQIQTTGAKPLLDTKDLETMFGMFDVTNRGVLTKQQAYRALKTILGPEHKVVKERSPDSIDDKTMLTKDQFVASLSQALTDAAPHPAA